MQKHSLPPTEGAKKIERETKAGDFRLFLQEELLKRVRKNPSYSLRSFAYFLKLDSGTLSQFLKGKRQLPSETKKEIARKLAVDPSTYGQLVENSSKKTGFQVNQLTLDVFQMIADWYHYAILELTQIEGFQPSTKWISKTLGITVSEANAAVERLMRLEFLEVTKDGRWVNASGNNTTIGNDFTAAAFRKLQRSVLEGALKAVDETAIEVRDQTSMTMAINSEQIPLAKEKIKKFRRELTALLQKDQKKDSVYQLGISFYPLTEVKDLEK